MKGVIASMNSDRGRYLVEQYTHPLSYITDKLEKSLYKELIPEVELHFDLEMQRGFPLMAKKFSRFAGYFKHSNAGKFNEYPNGVKSVVIEPGDDTTTKPKYFNREIPSTFGYLPIGNFEFNTGDKIETMNLLAGDLSWGIKGSRLIVPKQYDKLVIPEGEDLILKVKSPSLYICDYVKK